MKNINFSFGKQAKITLIGPDNQIPDLRKMARVQGAAAEKICIIKPPSDKTGEGYQTIAPKAVYGTSNDPTVRDVYAEGVILTENDSAAVIRTADCPTLVLFEKTTERLLVTHAGRAAMTPTNHLGEPIQNIVTKAHALLTSDCPNPHLLAYVTGSICPDCFPHADQAGQKLIEPFNQFDTSPITDKQRGSLDLPRLIALQLIELGVSPTTIWHDRICTYETTSLASFRRDRNEIRNVVIVTKH